MPNPTTTKPDDPSANERALRENIANQLDDVKQWNYETDSEGFNKQVDNLVALFVKAQAADRAVAINQAKEEAYRSVPEVRNLSDEGLEDLNRWLWEQIDVLKAERAALLSGEGEK